VKTGLHLKDAVLAHMPEEFNSLVRQSNVSEGHDMLSAPNLEAHVFVRVLEDRGAVNLDPEGCVRRTELGFLGILYQGVLQGDYRHILVIHWISGTSLTCYT
jgi:hypothetical protein